MCIKSEVIVRGVSFSDVFLFFLPHLRTLAKGKKGWKIVFVLGLVGRVSVSIIVAKYTIFLRANNGRSREKKNSGEAICSRY